MKHVCDVNTSINSDSDEWATLATICGSSQSVQDYAQGCQSQLWTDGLDQSSWASIKSGAGAAIGQSEDDAIVSVLTSYTNVTDPSHNSDQWEDLRQTASRLLVQINSQ